VEEALEVEAGVEEEGRVLPWVRRRHRRPHLLLLRRLRRRPVSQATQATTSPPAFPRQGLTLVHFSAQPEPCLSFDLPNVPHQERLC
jgi:hypothetical protein